MKRNYLADTRQFFDDFVEAFKSFDGATIAQRYSSTFIAVDSDGSMQSFDSSTSIANYFQGYLDDYYSQGCRSCAYLSLEATAIGQACILATVTWELYDDDGRIVSSWRESYNLAYNNDKLLVFASMDHADEPIAP